MKSIKVFLRNFVGVFSLTTTTAQFISPGIFSLLICLGISLILAIIFLTYRSFHFRRETGSNYKVIRGLDIKKENLRQALELDKQYYKDEFQGQLDRCLAWQRKNPDIYFAVIETKSDKLVGYINVMPIEQAYLEKIKHGDFHDASLPSEAILEYSTTGIYDLYFVSIAVHKAHRGGSSVHMLLRGAFLSFLLDSAKKGIFVSQLWADAVTPDGERISKTFGMKRHKSTAHGSQLMYVNMMPPEFNAMSELEKELAEIYRKNVDLVSTKHNVS